MQNTTKNWRDYQREVAEVFRALGLDATVEASIEGARGVHVVDVWVVFSRYGFDTKWLVECKFWASAVPKEKVLALHQIAQDVGADRAFLLSESGFQSGAIQVARHTNISLISLEDLKNDTAEELVNSSLASITKKLANLDGRISQFMSSDEGQPFPIPGPEKDEILSVAGAVFMLKLDLPKAINRQFPVYVTGVNSERTKVVDDASSFVRVANDVLVNIDKEIVKIVSHATKGIESCLVSRSSFVKAVEVLMENGKQALFCQAEEGSNEFESYRLIFLQNMKVLSEIADSFKLVSSGTIKEELYILMRFIVDTVYLHLTKPRVPLDEWESAELFVSDQIERLNQAQPVALKF